MRLVDRRLAARPSSSDARACGEVDKCRTMTRPQVKPMDPRARRRRKEMGKDMAPRRRHGATVRGGATWLGRNARFRTLPPPWLARMALVLELLRPGTTLPVLGPGGSLPGRWSRVVIHHGPCKNALSSTTHPLRDASEREPAMHTVPVSTDPAWRKIYT